MRKGRERRQDERTGDDVTRSIDRPTDGWGGTGRGYTVRVTNTQPPSPSTMSQNVQNVPDGQHKKKTFHSTGAIKTTSDRNGFRSSLQYQRCSLVIGPPLDVCLFVFFARVCVRESSTMLFACGSFFFSRARSERSRAWFDGGGGWREVVVPWRVLFEKGRRKGERRER